MQAKKLGPEMFEIGDLEANGRHGLSSRSRSKVAGFMPLLTTVHHLHHAGAVIDVDMAMGENWLIRDQILAICKKSIAEELDAKVG